ncbi:MAG: toll/interleukin-1 receptor domain-containing protein, partial [Actinomycetota bacterium]
MARVFLSYRRADGPYAVGWIAERLARLDEVTQVRTAFYDTELRAGDPYPAALDEAVAASDVVIAIIGPNWRGVRDDGSARILDDDDWVAREVGSALEHGTIVLPVLIDGADPLSAAHVRAEHAPLAELHALRFDGLDDLDEIERHLRSHLDEIDRRHAVERGLSEPLANPSLVPGTPVLVAAIGAAALGAALGWVTFDWFGDRTDADPDDLDGWIVATAVLWAVGAAAAVLGSDFVRRRFSDGARIRWRRSSRRDRRGRRRCGHR